MNKVAATDLIYYPDRKPGIARRRYGRGFSYIAPDGTRIECTRERARIKSLAVPPAYENVWISPLPNGHLQATGRDARGRKQYRYHANWTRQRAVRKYDQLAEFGRALPGLRRWISTRLQGEIGESETAIAAVLALIDRASLRVGHPAYTRENGSHGATTLRNRHVSFDGQIISLNYTAKGGKKVRKTVQGRQLQRVLQRCADLPGSELISWLDDDGKPRTVRSEQLNEIFGRICGEGMTAKTLRTWNGSHAAFQLLLHRKQVTITDMADAAAARLHNTPAIARSSYIHPDIIALAEMEEARRSRQMDSLRSIRSQDRLRAGEAELLAFLS